MDTNAIFQHRGSKLSRMLPYGTYRIQLNKEFTFEAAAAQADYYRNLGVSHMYCSPYLQATPGSMHGYDVVDHSRVNDELGGATAHYEFCMALGRNNLGQILDIVPNHMAIGLRANKWWWDVLENGPSSAYASFFDVEWDPPEAKLRNRVLIPVLGDHYGRVLEGGQLKLRYEGGNFTVHYYEHVVPVAPEALALVLRRAARVSGSAELAFAADLLAELPVPTEKDEDKVIRRHRDKELLRQGVKRLYDRDEAIRAVVDSAIEEINSNPDALDEILSHQNYRLAHWRTAGRNLPYRRFFDINTLAGLRMEDRKVFDATHRLTLDWLRDGVIDGVRVDHPDGLRDPEMYFRRIRNAAPHAWVVAEKILEPGERLRGTWEIAGTTGYDFAFTANNILVNREAETALSNFYRDFTGETTDYAEAARDSKLMILRGTLGSDVNRLTAIFHDICESHRTQRDHTRHDIHHALREIIASFRVYRTYVNPETNTITEDDIRYITEAIDDARGRRPDLPADLFDFLQAVLLLHVRGPLENEFVFRFQQFTGPAMAKGVEDTVFYRFNRLVSLNEVGGDPGRFGFSLDEFHDWCDYMQRHWPEGMVTTSTHDTKRSEDVRARIHVLSEVPAEWAAAVARWSRLNERHRRDDMPDRNTEYLLYQTLIGLHPIELDRLQAYMLKASREAKLQTSWMDPNTAYEDALSHFVRGAYENREFLTDLETFLRPLIGAARINSLVQALLKFTVPGVPDIYQGTEIWDFSLVDPDNRRPVDYRLRRDMLSRLEDTTPEQVLEGMDEGLPKLWVIRQALRTRCQRRDVFGRDGHYRPVIARGAKSDHVIAFLRADFSLTVVPRCTLVARAEWADTAIDIPEGTWRNRLTGDLVNGGNAPVADLWKRFPVALLTRE